MLLVFDPLLRLGGSLFPAFLDATFHFHLHSLKEGSLNSSGGPLGPGMMEDYGQIYEFLSTGDYPMEFTKNDKTCTEKEV